MGNKRLIFLSHFELGVVVIHLINAFTAELAKVGLTFYD